MKQAAARGTTLTVQDYPQTLGELREPFLKEHPGKAWDSCP